MTSPIGSLMPLLDYQQRSEHLFPSLESIRWFIRKNKGELVREGALLEIAGRVQINPPAFDSVILTVGSRTAQSKVAA